MIFYIEVKASFNPRFCFISDTYSSKISFNSDELQWKRLWKKAAYTFVYRNKEQAIKENS